MSGIRCINRPDIDVLFLRVVDGGVEVWTGGSEVSTEIVDARRDEQDGAAFAGVGPPLDQVLEGEIGTGKRAASADGNAQGFGGEGVVIGEILREHGRAVASVGHGD